MDGRAFLTVADNLVAGSTEADWRTAVGRAYYGLMHECWSALLRWGFVIPPRENVHSFVRLRFSYAADAGLRSIGHIVDRLGQWRNGADYHLNTAWPYNSNVRAQQAAVDARATLAVLNAIEADPVRRNAAIAGIRAAWP